MKKRRVATLLILFFLGISNTWAFLGPPPGSVPVAPVLQVVPTTTRPLLNQAAANAALLDEIIMNQAAYKSAAIAPAAGGSLGLMGLSLGAASGAGIAYYARTGQDPVLALASAASNAAASAADHIFVPIYQAYMENFVTPESFPASVPTLVGSPGWFGASLEDFFDYLKNDSSPSDYPLLKDIVNQSTIPASEGGMSSPQVGDISDNLYGCSVVNTAGPAYAGYAAQVISYSPVQHYNWVNQPPPAYSSGTSHVLCSYPYIYLYTNIAPFSGGWTFDVQTVHWSVINAIPNFTPTFTPAVPVHVDPVQFNQKFKERAVSPPVGAPSTEFDEWQDFVNECHDVLTNLRLSTQGVAGNYPSNIPAMAPMGGITAQDQANFAAKNSTEVANQSLNSINPNSTPQEIAQAAAAAAAAAAASLTAAQQTANQTQPQTITFPDITAQGDAELPPPNEYDPNVAPVEEKSFVQAVHDFLNSGLPVMSAISTSSLSASGSPKMSCMIWDHLVEVDFTDQTGVLDAAGIFLVGIAMIYSFLIIVRS